MVLRYTGIPPKYSLTMFIKSDDVMSSRQFHPSKVETFSLKKALMIKLNAFQCKVVSSRYIHRTLISVMWWKKSLLCVIQWIFSGPHFALDRSKLLKLRQIELYSWARWNLGIKVWKNKNVVFILGKSETSNLQDSIELNEFVSAISFHYFVIKSWIRIMILFILYPNSMNLKK